MSKDPLKAKCWNCDRKYDQVKEKHGGIVGTCHKCDSLQWIVAPSEARRRRTGKEKKV